MTAGCTETSPESSPSSGAMSSGGTGTSGISVDVSAMNSILASTYLQMSDLNMTFINFKITNPTGSTQMVTVESEVPGYTEKSFNTVEVPSHGDITVGQTPSLRPGAIPTEMTSAMLHYKVALADGTRIDEQTYPIKIYAKDTMVWSIFDGTEWNDMTPYIAAWGDPSCSRDRPAHA